MTRLISRDEREAMVDLAADRLTSLVLAYGLLAIVVYRSLAGEATWDLLGLVVLGGIVGLAYRWQKRAASGRWIAMLVGTIVIAAVIAAILALKLPR